MAGALTGLFVFPAADLLARVAAAEVAARIAAGLEEDGRFRLALSGGATPVPLYRALAAGRHADRVDWNRVIVLFADERAVPPDHPDSNYRLARETLLGPAGVPEENVHRLHGEWPDLERAAADYERHLERPIDLALLGIGSDGHTCSIFPGSPLVFESVRRAAAVTDSPKPPARRLTLTARALAEARRAMVIVTGRDKAGAVAKARDEATDPRALPARLLRDREWWLDAAAAGAEASPAPSASA